MMDGFNMPSIDLPSLFWHSNLCKLSFRTNTENTMSSYRYKFFRRLIKNGYKFKKMSEQFQAQLDTFETLPGETHSIINLISELDAIIDECYKQLNKNFNMKKWWLSMNE